jgi:hypothetical protein
VRHRPSDLLRAARLELARRGDPRWAPLLRRAEQLLAQVELPPDLPAGQELEHALRRASRPAREALRELLEALATTGR